MENHSFNNFRNSSWNNRKQIVHCRDELSVEAIVNEHQSDHILDEMLLVDIPMSSQHFFHFPQVHTKTKQTFTKEVGYNIQFKISQSSWMNRSVVTSLIFFKPWNTCLQLSRGVVSGRKFSLIRVRKDSIDLKCIAMLLWSFRFSSSTSCLFFTFLYSSFKPYWSCWIICFEVLAEMSSKLLEHIESKC